MNCYICKASVEKGRMPHHYQTVHGFKPIEENMRLERNARERRRVEKIKNSYKRLAANVPSLKQGRVPRSKLQIINSAIKYIKHLESVLDGNLELEIQNLSHNEPCSSNQLTSVEDFAYNEPCSSNQLTSVEDFEFIPCDFFSPSNLSETADDINPF
jgi:hypothetical protein